MGGMAQRVAPVRLQQPRRFTTKIKEIMKLMTPHSVCFFNDPIQITVSVSVRVNLRKHTQSCDRFKKKSSVNVPLFYTVILVVWLKHILDLPQGRGDGPKANRSRASEAARVKAELDCVTLWVCFAYMPKP